MPNDTLLENEEQEKLSEEGFIPDPALFEDDEPQPVENLRADEGAQIEEQAQQAESRGGFAETAVLAPQKRLRRRKKAPFIIGGAVLLLLVGGIIFWQMNKKDKAPAEEILDDTVMRGSITSLVEGSGQVKPHKSETISVGISGTLRDVYVTEGQEVAAGTVLYLIDSPGADDAVEKARKDVQGYQKQLKELYDGKANLNVRPEFSGKIIEVEKLKVGDSVEKGKKLARLIDDSKMKLTQYYSYAYEGDVYIGMPASVSIPGVMQQVSGSVSEVLKVERISAEGAKLFSVSITLDNPGTLSEKMSASATLTAGGEQISPYELGALEYNRVVDLNAKVGGKVISNNMHDYLKVSAGQSVMLLDGEDNDNQIFTLESSLKTAQETLETAIKNKENLQATAPIDGTVVGLSLAPGDEVTANSTILMITDSTQMIVEAMVDERNVSFVKAGMMAEIDQYGNMTMGTVESISLSGKFENGITNFPAKIVIDNADGRINGGSAVYRLQASQSEDCLVLPSQCVKSVPDPETGETTSVVFVKADSAPEGSIAVDGASLGVPATGYYAVPVEIGIADKFNVEIVSGVEEGTVVFSQVVRQNTFGGGMMIG